ncbi:hypothetical protein OROGR_000779 [Orobanche gracilis]
MWVNVSRAGNETEAAKVARSVASSSLTKVLGIQYLAAELDLKCITTYKLDALKSVAPESQDAPQCGENENIKISDSSKPEIENLSHDTVESLRIHAKYQRRMFDQAVQLLCTINPGENEAFVRYALNTYKFLSLASQHPKMEDLPNWRLSIF